MNNELLKHYAGLAMQAILEVTYTGDDLSGVPSHAEKVADDAVIYAEALVKRVGRDASNLTLDFPVGCRVVATPGGAGTVKGYSADLSGSSSVIVELLDGATANVPPSDLKRFQSV